MSLSQRSCSTCSVCCHVAEVQGHDFLKPAWKPCKEICTSASGSCGIFNSVRRPTVCSTFQCSWLRGYGEENDRPDQSGIMVSVNEFNGGRWIVAIETEEGALLGKGKNIVMDIANKIDLPVIVLKYGSLPPNDKGDFTVIKDSLLTRTNSMRGKLVSFLDDTEQYGIYELVVE